MPRGRSRAAVAEIEEVADEKTLIGINNASNDGLSTVEFSMPYVVNVKVEGSSAMLFHRWSVDGVEAKSKAAKGSKAKKSDDIESYIYRDEENNVCIPAEYFRQSIINAAKFKQDPRSPRKSAMDLFKAGITTMDDLCSLGTKNWQYIDRRRVRVQQSAITRERPAFRSGWACNFGIMVILPEYISASLLNEVLQSAGRLIGVADFRPTFGRFQVTGFEIFQN